MTISSGGVPLIPQPEVQLRVNAMAAEFREIIGSMAQHATDLAVSNALANKMLQDQQAEIEKLKKELEAFKPKDEDLPPTAAPD